MASGWEGCNWLTKKNPIRGLPATWWEACLLVTMPIPISKEIKMGWWGKNTIYYKHLFLSESTYMVGGFFFFKKISTHCTLPDVLLYKIRYIKRYCLTLKLKLIDIYSAKLSHYIFRKSVLNIKEQDVQECIGLCIYLHWTRYQQINLICHYEKMYWNGTVVQFINIAHWRSLIEL